MVAETLRPSSLSSPSVARLKRLNRRGLKSRRRSVFRRTELSCRVCSHSTRLDVGNSRLERGHGRATPLSACSGGRWRDCMGTSSSSRISSSLKTGVGRVGQVLTLLAGLRAHAHHTRMRAYMPACLHASAQCPCPIDVHARVRTRMHTGCGSVSSRTWRRSSSRRVEGAHVLMCTYARVCKLMPSCY